MGQGRWDGMGCWAERFGACLPDACLRVTSEARCEVPRCHHPDGTGEQPGTEAEVHLGDDLNKAHGGHMGQEWAQRNGWKAGS